MSIVTRSYRYPLRPRRGQHRHLLDALAEHRALYNRALAAYEDAYVEARRLHCGLVLPDPTRPGVVFDYRRNVWHIDRPKDAVPGDPLMPQLVKRGDKWTIPEPPSMAELYRTLPTTALGGKWRVWTLSRLEIALREFRRRPEVGYPHYHGYRTHSTLGAGAQNNSPVRILHMPAKYPGQAVAYIGGIMVRMPMHRPLPPSAVVKCAVVTRDHARRRWHICLQCEIDEADEAGYACRSADMPIGLDLGIIKPIATTDHRHFVETPAALRRAQRKIKERQRALSCCRRASKRRRRARDRLARAHAKAAAIRKGWVHKQSAVFSRQYRMIALEALSLSKMQQPDPDHAPAVKRMLNREFSSVAPGMIREALAWKSQRAGGVVVTVDPAYTSQTCWRCGAKVPLANQMRCAECHTIIDRATGAARNVLARARAQLVSSAAAEGLPTGWPATGEGNGREAIPNEPQTLPSGATPAMYSGGLPPPLSARHHPGRIERLSAAELAGIARIRKEQQDQRLASDERRQKRIAAMSAARTARALAKRAVSAGNGHAMPLAGATR